MPFIMTRQDACACDWGNMPFLRKRDGALLLCCVRRLGCRKYELAPRMEVFSFFIQQKAVGKRTCAAWANCAAMRFQKRSRREKKRYVPLIYKKKKKLAA